MPAEQWQSLLMAHLGGTANACAAFVPSMVKAGRGTVITMSSRVALTGGIGQAYLAAASGSILGFTKSLALELARQGVRVNCIAAGAATEEEIGETVAFLVRDAGFFVGQVLSPEAAR
jgi:NAD(P)-dependent dehydrogenase (short-subunit alcohol dehydrogenase family)